MEALLDWKSIGSMLATFMFLRTAIRDFLPPEIYGFITRLFSCVFRSLNPRVTIVVDEYDSTTFNSYNVIFDDVQSYLSTRCFSTSNVLKLFRPKNSRALSFAMDTTQSLKDTSLPGIPVKWSFNSIERKTSSPFRSPQEHRSFTLSFHRGLKSKVYSEYIPYIMEEAEAIRFRNRERLLYTNRALENDGRHWSSVAFNHPANFDTIAIDPVLLEDLKADLLKFIKRQEYYSRVGRPWKRGYLLHGPPGTGKTSLIAAIANFLEFDIYDLELTAVTSNSQLRKLLISTTSKSVIVVEDVDCTLDLSDRKKRTTKEDEEDINASFDAQFTGKRNKGKADGQSSNYDNKLSLSGVLNFVDGLWSSSVGERLMIFTTNHIEKLDPALLRPGRMDKHVHLSYCRAAAFKKLAKNYLYVKEGDHEDLMREAAELLPEAHMTPADVAEVFMSCNDDAERGLTMAVEEMKRRSTMTVELGEENGKDQQGLPAPAN